MIQEITEDELILNGWIPTKDPVTPYKKGIVNKNPINSLDEDTGISLCLHRLFNVYMFAVILPDGGLLNFYAESIEALNSFEKMINEINITTIRSLSRLYDSPKLVHDMEVYGTSVHKRSVGKELHRQNT